VGKRAKREPVEVELSALVSDAASEITSLKEEIEEWRDNMSNANMEHLPKWEEVSEAADALDQAESQAQDAENTFDGLPDAAKVLNAKYLAGKTTSRSSRAGECGAMLRIVADRLRELAEMDEKLEKPKGVEPVDYEEAAEALESAADELDNVSFPGMY